MCTETYFSSQPVIYHFSQKYIKHVIIVTSCAFLNNMDLSQEQKEPPGLLKFTGLVNFISFILFCKNITISDHVTLIKLLYLS